MQIVTCINAMHLWVMVLMIPSMVIILYLYITAQPKRVRQRKVGLENLKTWGKVKSHKVEKHLNAGDLDPAIFVDQQNGCETA